MARRKSAGAQPADAVKQTAEKRIGSGKAGPGRPKGVPNKNTTLLKDAILEAATKAGGRTGLVGYLETQAATNPGPFMALLGKVLPMQVVGPDDGPVSVIMRRVVDAHGIDDTDA